MSDISWKENETEQILRVKVITLHYGEWNANFVNDF